MKKPRSNSGHFLHLLCITGAVVITVSTATPLVAQTNAAAMAVRQRVEGLQNGPPGPEGQPAAVPRGPGPGANPYPSAPQAGKLDTRYISPNAAIVVVLRPAQFMASPLGQVFPVEVVTAAGQKYLGFDPAEMDEVIAFGELGPTGLAYGLTVKFKNPIRASSIQPILRAHAQLADLNGKKYLRSAVPMMPSFYGPNNKTLVVATDAALQQLVTSATQPKTGPTIDRLRDIPSGSDFFVSVDFTPLRPLMQKGLQAPSGAPAEVKQQIEQAKPYLSLLDGVSAFEFTLNASVPGSTSLVVHCTDEAAAQKLESTIQEGIQKARTPDPSAQPNPDDPIAQGLDRYRERLLQLIQPQRNGTTITCLHVDGQNPSQQQLVSAAIIAAVTKMQSEGSKVGAAKGKRAKVTQTPSGPVGPEGQPVGPEGQAANPQGPVGPEGQRAGPEGQPLGPEGQPAAQSPERR